MVPVLILEGKYRDIPNGALWWELPKSLRNHLLLFFFLLAQEFDALPCSLCSEVTWSVTARGRD